VFVRICTKAGSSNVWYGGGQPWSHSTLVVVSSTARTSRLAAKASHRMNKNMITATREIRDPIEETVFHRV